jgi:uncharacterized membrane protein YhhN
MIALVKRFATALFFLTMLAFIGGGFLKNDIITTVTKPLLIPLLMLLVFVSTRPSGNRNIILAALLFSFAGDVLLLYESTMPGLFIPGLVSFLLTHILYIVYFLSTRPKRMSLLKTAPYLGLLVAAYGIFLLYLLFPHLGDLKIPVSIYAVVILCMVLCTIHIYKRVSPPVGKLFITGALFFILSDSLLAFDKFHTSLNSFSFLIILTYCIAQWLIVSGFIQKERHR